MVNVWGIVAGSLLSFFIGGLWYSPLLFGRAWMRLNGLTDEDLAKGDAVRVFGGALALSVVLTTNLAFFLGPDQSLGFGLAIGAATGIGWVGSSLGILYLFERKPLRLFLINAGYCALTYTLIGGLLAAFQ